MHAMTRPASRPELHEAAVPDCEVILAGRVGYDEAVAMMDARVRARREGLVPDALILVEHDPVITLGRNARADHVLFDEADLARRGIALRECGRGGDVTYHGPGQLVGYPVIAIEPARRDVRRYLRDIEEVVIRALAGLGIAAGRREGLTGVWVGEAKIASIGVRLSRWVTSHGFALNVGGDLSGFDAIVPCGIAGCRTTSIAKLTGREVGIGQVAAPLARHFGEVFGRRMRGAGEGRP